MNNYSDWIRLKASMLGVRECFDDPRLRAIAFDYKVNNQFLFITPKCIVTKPPSRLIGLQLEGRSNITIEESDYYVRSVPRDIPSDALNTRCWLDAEIVNNLLTGISCRVHYIDDKKSLSYNLILKREIEQKRFN